MHTAAVAAAAAVSLVPGSHRSALGLRLLQVLSKLVLEQPLLQLVWNMLVVVQLYWELAWNSFALEQQKLELVWNMIALVQLKLELV